MGECTIYGMHKNGFKPFASMPLTNLLQVSHSLVFRYQQNLPNLFCSCSQHNRGYFIIIIFLFSRVCVFEASEGKREASQERQKRARGKGAPRTLHTCLSLQTADVFSVVASLPPKRRPEICLLFAGCTCLRSPEKRKKKRLLRRLSLLGRD